MSAFDGVIAIALRRDGDGSVTFAPFGARGKCYIVPPEREQHLRRFFRVFFVAMVIAVVVSVWFVGLWSVVILVPVFLSLLFLKYWHFTRALAVAVSAPAPLSRSESLSVYTQAIGRRKIWFCIGVTILFSIAGVWMVIDKGDAESYFVTAVSLFGFIVSLRMLRAMRQP
jgi:hypothetical protein